MPDFRTEYLSETRAQFGKLRSAAERAMGQVSDEDFARPLDEENNSIAITVKHVSGNLRSRCTDSLTSDGEKPDRDRDREFVLEPRDTRARLMTEWAAWSGTACRDRRIPEPGRSAADGPHPSRAALGLPGAQSQPDPHGVPCRADRAAGEALGGAWLADPDDRARPIHGICPGQAGGIRLAPGDLGIGRHFRRSSLVWFVELPGLTPSERASDEAVATPPPPLPRLQQPPRHPSATASWPSLGNDTVSVERIARSPTRLVTDGVDRWPFVRRRHTEFDLAADGTIRHMVMDVRTPNGPSPRERGRRVTADFSKDTVNISVRDSSGVRDTSFATGGAITVPHVSMMYSVIELEIAAALRQAAATGLAAGDSVLFRQFYPDRDVGPELHPAPGLRAPACRRQGGAAARLAGGDRGCDGRQQRADADLLGDAEHLQGRRRADDDAARRRGDRGSSRGRGTTHRAPAAQRARYRPRHHRRRHLLGGLRSSPRARAHPAGQRDRLRPGLAHGRQCRDPVHHLGADHARGIVAAGGDVHPVDRTARRSASTSS